MCPGRVLAHGTTAQVSHVVPLLVAVFVWSGAASGRPVSADARCFHVCSLWHGLLPLKMHALHTVGFMLPVIRQKLGFSSGILPT